MRISHDSQSYLFVDVWGDDLEQEGHEEPRHEGQVGVQACDDAHSRGRRPICNFLLDQITPGYVLAASLKQKQSCQQAMSDARKKKLMRSCTNSLYNNTYL